MSVLSSTCALACLTFASSALGLIRSSLKGGGGRVVRGTISGVFRPHTLACDMGYAPDTYTQIRVWSNPIVHIARCCFSAECLTRNGSIVLPKIHIRAAHSVERDNCKQKLYSLRV